MRRGKTQVLFKYLPGKPIDADERGLGKVTAWTSTPVDGLNKERILREIYETTEGRFKNRKFPPQLDATRFRLLTPKGVEYTLFPLTFTCSNAICGAAFTFRDAANFNSYVKSGKCPRCHEGIMTQMDLVHVEREGRIGFPQISPCEEHGKQYIRLRKGGSENPGEWRFTCGICTQPTKGGGSLNSSSKFLGASYKEILYPSPIRKSQVYIPHSVLLVNLQNIDEKRLYEDKRFQKKILADYLDIFNNKNLKFEDYIEVADENAQKQSDMIEKLRGKVPEQYLADIQRELESKYPDKAKTEMEIISELESIIDLSRINLTKTANSLFEYLQMLEKAGAIGLKKLIAVAEAEHNPNLENIKEFPKRIQAIKVANAYVLNDLSIVQAVYGFSRSDFDAKEVDLCAFPPDKNYPTDIPIYVNQVDTEAIVLEFDRRAIMTWLADNKIIDPKEIPDTDQKAKAWFLENVNLDMINRFEEIPEDDHITKHVFSLIHSATHCLILKATVLCGLDKDSMSELIFAQIPAIVIYANNTSGTQTGGMFTLFENRIYPWIDQTLKSMSTCIYDPLCAQHQGACHACMYLSEFSCCHFNNDLSRKYLTGNHKNIKGYWENAKL